MRVVGIVSGLSIVGGVGIVGELKFVHKFRRGVRGWVGIGRRKGGLSAMRGGVTKREAATLQ